MVHMAQSERKRAKRGRSEVSPPTRIIACGAFRSALETLRVLERYPNLNATFLPSNLHLWPQTLKRYFSREVRKAQKDHERVICLYGECFPSIDEFCEEKGIVRIPGLDCSEMLLGSARFHTIMDETAGTYFLEKELIVNFKEYCAEPLELYDEEIRNAYFKHYTRLIYVRQPSDSNLVPTVKKVAQFLHLSFEIRDADYLYLDEKIAALMERKSSFPGR